LIEKKMKVNDSEMFMVGDSFESDIAPTIKRGWKAIQIVRKGGKKRNSNYIANLYELGSYL